MSYATTPIAIPSPLLQAIHKSGGLFRNVLWRDYILQGTIIRERALKNSGLESAVTFTIRPATGIVVMHSVKSFFVHL